VAGGAWVGVAAGAQAARMMLNTAAAAITDKVMRFM
jgi:hypothetical protein